jgi:hypothetical protein
VAFVEIESNFTYRYNDANARKLFGYGLAACRVKIEAGEIPPPIPLSDTGYIRGWFGRQIIAWQEERIEAAKLVPIRKRPQDNPPPRPKGPLDIGKKRRKRGKA